MAPKTRAVTAKALQSLLVRIGAASSGTKSSLEERFRHDITRPRLFTRRPEWELSRPTDEKLRVVSIDMGIKNLAFCEAEISYPVKDSLNATMDVLRWEKIDLAPATRDSETSIAQPSATEKRDMGADEDLDPYSLDVLSRTAYKLVKETILPGTPDVILIEKQRWRSGGGSAVQQWTLRVNTLEGMLWAVLKTLYAERLGMLRKEMDLNQGEEKGLYDVFGVDPKRVGHYWLGQSAQRHAGGEGTSSLAAGAPEEAGPKLSRSKAEKKAKISLLRSWLTASPASTASTTTKNTPTISFKIGKNAQSTYQALCFPVKPSRSKKKSTVEETPDSVPEDMSAAQMKKLDDVADCFLQAAAWVSWESNRVQLRDIWRKRLGAMDTLHDGDSGSLDNSVLLDMLREVEG
ncbi:uncharacterized protein yc1106_03764 [Curvularia clavata]|uniref:Mitochondrial resolvase Ydc2 catalytic domain-containing protein n=1 Tax=Curvularia clavata TaxID=95742 RepID=A0A9Q8Z798_CURCL|nr:uncharacterized protein yc1106_03764 [Curvularia clavata]